jgi:hypothetical protein
MHLHTGTHAHTRIDLHTHLAVQQGSVQAGASATGQGQGAVGAEREMCLQRQNGGGGVCPWTGTPCCLLLQHLPPLEGSERCTRANMFGVCVCKFVCVCVLVCVRVCVRVCLICVSRVSVCVFYYV